MGRVEALKTECHRGHQMQGSNLYLSPNGGRRCRECRNTNERSRRLRKQDHMLGISRAWRETNRDRISTYNKSWHETNRDHRLEAMKMWRDTNKEERATYNRRWYEDHREQVATYNKAWRERNLDKRRQHQEKRRSILAGVTATLTNGEWLEIQDEFDQSCFWCGSLATTLEHIVPLQPREGELRGHHVKGNVVPSCRPCNSSKRNMDPLRFYFRRQEGVQV